MRAAAGELAADLRRCAEALPRAGEPAAVAAPPVAAGTDASVATQAQATLTTAAPGPAVLGLLPWRRFDSSRALERLARPQGADRSLLAPVSSRKRVWMGVLRDRVVLQAGATLAAAAAIALAIAFG